MKKIILSLSFIILFSGCGKSSKKETTNIKVNSSSIQELSGTSGYTQGLIIAGKHNITGERFSRVLTNSSSVTVELAQGPWNISVTGWIDPADPNAPTLTGTTYCDSINNFNVQPGIAPLELIPSISKCSSLASSSFYNSGENSFRSLELITCSDLKGANASSHSFFCLGQDNNPEKLKLAHSFRIRPLQLDQNNIINSSAVDNAYSKCVNDIPLYDQQGLRMGATDVLSFKLPYKRLPFEIRLYSNTNCLDNSQMANFTFLDGLEAPSDKYTYLIFNDENSTANLFIPTNIFGIREVNTQTSDLMPILRCNTNEPCLKIPEFGTETSSLNLLYPNVAGETLSYIFPNFASSSAFSNIGTQADNPQSLIFTNIESNSFPFFRTEITKNSGGEIIDLLEVDSVNVDLTYTPINKQKYFFLKDIFEIIGTVPSQNQNKKNNIFSFVDDPEHAYGHEGILRKARMLYSADGLAGAFNGNICGNVATNPKDITFTEKGKIKQYRIIMTTSNKQIPSSLISFHPGLTASYDRKIVVRNLTNNKVEIVAHYRCDESLGEIESQEDESSAGNTKIYKEIIYWTQHGADSENLFVEHYEHSNKTISGALKTQKSYIRLEKKGNSPSEIFILENYYDDYEDLNPSVPFDRLYQSMTYIESISPTKKIYQSSWEKFDTNIFNNFYDTDVDTVNDILESILVSKFFDYTITGGLEHFKTTCANFTSSDPLTSVSNNIFFSHTLSLINTQCPLIFSSGPTVSPAGLNGLNATNPLLQNDFVELEGTDHNNNNIVDPHDQFKLKTIPIKNNGTLNFNTLNSLRHGAGGFESIFTSPALFQ